MSTDPTSSDPMGGGERLTEEDLRAAYEAELKQIRVEQLVLEQAVSLINFGMRRTGLAPGTEDERDPGQVRIAIEAVRALLPLVEEIAPRQATPIREALSQLQLAFVRLSGASGPAATADAGSPAGAGSPDESAGAGATDAPTAPPEPAPDPIKPGEPGPAERSGRLWVPGS